MSRAIMPLELIAHQVIEKRCEMILGREFEEEDRTEMMNSGRHAAALEDGIKVVHETPVTWNACRKRFGSSTGRF